MNIPVATLPAVEANSEVLVVVTPDQHDFTATTLHDVFTLLIYPNHLFYLPEEQTLSIMAKTEPVDIRHFEILSAGLCHPGRLTEEDWDRCINAQSAAQFRRKSRADLSKGVLIIELKPFSYDLHQLRGLLQ